jgi:hypothetical protein
LPGLAALACGPADRVPIAMERGQSTSFTFPYVDPAVAGAPAEFGGVSGPVAGAPVIAYPLDGAMHPINVGQITFQWTRGAAASRVFRLRLDDGGAQYDFYLPCTSDACLFTVPSDGWLTIAHAHPDGQLVATVAGTDGAGGPVYQSTPISVRFSPEAVAGGLYYWTATSGGGTTYRLPFGSPSATPFIVPSSPSNPLPCGGCHSVSRDGSVISFVSTADPGSQVAFLAASETSAPNQPMIEPTGGTNPTGTSARFTALNADGSRVLVTTFGHIAVYDTHSGQPIDIGNTDALMPRNKLVTHPEWSPSGSRVAFTLYSAQLSDGSGGMRTVSDSRPEDGEIVTLELDATTGKATRLRTLVSLSNTDGMAHDYPSWSPDEQWLVVAAVPKGTSAYLAATARLRLIKSGIDNQVCPGPTCFELAKASQGVNVSSTWPKLSPFLQASGQMFFVTFSSKIDYGLILKNQGTDGALRAQLWMSAIDLRTLNGSGSAGASADPSLAPVWLPFQDVTQTNHLPFWTAIVACSSDGLSYASCGRDEVCDNGQCKLSIP